MLKLKIKGQTVTWIDKELTVEGSNGIYPILFEFEDDDDLPEWGTLEKLAVFKNPAMQDIYPDGVHVDIVGNLAIIPGIILATVGYLYIGVFGTNGSGSIQMPTVWAPPIYIKPGVARGAVPTPITYEGRILSDTTAGWDSQVMLVSEKRTIYVYTDHTVTQDSEGNTVYIPGFKVGDGNAYLIDLPYTDQVVQEHMADGTIHVTLEEKAFWNNKVRTYIDEGSENLMFTIL